MVYGRGAYNRSAYNHGSTKASIKPLAIKGVSKFAQVRPRAALHLRGSITGKAELAGRMKISLRLSGRISGRGEVSPARMVVIQVIKSQDISGKGEFLATMLRLYGSEAINLRGIVLLPGQTLSINTETLTVEINGQNAIKYWQTGSAPIMLSGTGELIYYDDSQERTAQMSIIYSDRWL